MRFGSGNICTAGAAACLYLLLVLAPFTAAQADEDPAGLDEITVDLTLLSLPFEIERANRANLQLSVPDDDSAPVLRVTTIRTRPEQFEDRPFASPSYVEYRQPFCERNFGGTCTITVLDDPGIAQMMLRSVRETDGAILLEIERWIGAMIVSASTIVEPGTSEDAALADLSALAEQIFSAFPTGP